jgi:hypothetical protein
MGSIFFLLLALLAVVVISVAIYGIYSAAKRKRELAAWAQARGLVFSEERVPGLDNQFSAFECLKRGDDRYAFNTMEGNYADRRFFGFDYHYETHSTDSKGHRETHDHYFSAAMTWSDVPLKPLVIRPESILDKLAGFVGFEDIDFESAEFSRKFYVKSPDRRWAYDVIHARTMELLLAMPQFHIQFDRDCVMAWRDGTFSPADFEAAAEVIRGMLDRLPEYLVKQQEGT